MTSVPSILDAVQLATGDPRSNSLASTGTVIAVDAVGHTVQVAIRQDPAAVVTLPAVAARYQVGGTCRVLHNPDDAGRAILVLGTVTPLAPYVLGTLSGANSSTYRATVVVLGQSVVIPYAPTGTYTGGSRVWVALDDWGQPSIVLAPSSEAAATTPPTAPETGGGATTVQTVVAIGPQWSGSYRAGRGWDRWNTSRADYGGRSTLYQGSGFGSGQMIGLATYGDQLVNLGAISIDRVLVMLRPVGLSGAAGPAVVQGAVDGAQPAGAPTTGGVTAVGEGWVELPAAICESMRGGGVKGLATVGPNYFAVAGAGNGDGMVLEVTYTRPA